MLDGEIGLRIYPRVTTASSSDNGQIEANSVRLKVLVSSSSGGDEFGSSSGGGSGDCTTDARNGSGEGSSGEGSSGEGSVDALRVRNGDVSSSVAPLGGIAFIEHSEHESKQPERIHVQKDSWYRRCNSGSSGYSDNSGNSANTVMVPGLCTRVLVEGRTGHLVHPETSPTRPPKTPIPTSSSETCSTYQTVP